MNTNNINSFYFPSGFTVAQCKQEARELKDKYKRDGEFLTYSAALNMIAFDHANMKWDDAIKMVQEEQERIKYHIARRQNPTENLSPEDELETYKAVAEQYFLKNGKLMVPDTIDSEVEMFPHNGEGLLITHKALELIDKTINVHGGIHKATTDLVDFKVVFKDDENQKQTHEFYFNNAGLLIFYVRKNGGQEYPNFFATHYMICFPGEAPRPIQTASHYLEFVEEWGGEVGKLEATESFDA